MKLGEFEKAHLCEKGYSTLRRLKDKRDSKETVTIEFGLSFRLSLLLPSFPFVISLFHGSAYAYHVHCNIAHRDGRVQARAV